jgi:hypothetical protein
VLVRVCWQVLACWRLAVGWACWLLALEGVREKSARESAGIFILDIPEFQRIQNLLCQQDM